MNKILVIGAQNIDIFAKSEEELSLGDSKPAKINLAFGGVGRNIAVNLKRLGQQVHFLTAFGADAFSESARNSLERLEIKYHESLIVGNSNSSIYIGILDQNNDLYLGFHDMQTIEQLNPEFLKSKLDYIRDFDLIVVDNNLTEESIAFLLSHLKGKIIAMDAVSTHKARKLKNYLNKISILKLNQFELDALSDFTSSEKQLEDLHHKGAQTILLTNKENESSVSKVEGLFSQKPEYMQNIINATGAGDAFLCGYLHGLILKKPEEVRLKMANFAARLTLLSEESTSLQLSSEILEKAINE